MWYMNEERELIREAAQRFAETEVQPGVKEMENGVYAAKLVKRMGELGFTGLPYPEAIGGVGKDWTTYGIVLEEVSKVSTTLSLNVLLQTVMSGIPLAVGGTPEQQQKYLKPCLEGKEILAISNTEPAGMINVSEFQTRAVLDGDEWVLNGGKIFTSGAGQANNYVVAALTSDFDIATQTGLSLFLLPADTPGFKVGHIEKKLGWNGSSTGSVYYDNVRLPKANLIGELGAGAGILAQMSGLECLCFGSMCLGAAEAVYAKTLKYTRERIQMGKSLFETHQVMRHDLAKMHIEIEGLRGMNYTVLSMVDEGNICVPLMLAMKVKGAQVMEYVASRAIDLHGGNGVIVDNDVERFYRDAKVNAIGGGASGFLTELISSML